MSYSAITAAVSYSPVVAGLLLIFAALAGLHVVLTGARLLIDAINDDDNDDATDDESEDE